jgi:AbrB family looped-hinge helix DNA binding protein
MQTTRLSSKGQVILPKSIREARRWRVGTEFEVENTAEGVLLRPLKNLEPSRLEEVAGRLATARRPKTLREMEAAIEAELGARRDRGRY